MKNFISPGDTLTFTAGTDIASGDGVLVGSLFGIATGDVKVTKTGTLKLTGVFDLPKTASQTWAVGDPVYWDAGDSVCTKTASTHKLIGTAVLAVGGTAGETTGRVRLIGVTALASS